jgi:hypothetical protein
MKQYFSILLFSLLYTINTCAQSPNLGTTINFALFTSNGAVSNSGPSNIYGNVGAHTGAISGFGSPANHNGTVESANSTTAQCLIDTQALYDELFATPQTVFGHAPAFGSGETLYPGVYAEAGAGSVLLNLTLDALGDPCAIFIFKFGGAFNSGAGTNVILTNGAQSSNVFWISAGAIAMAADTKMKGTLISSPGAVSMAAGGILEGRMLSTTGAIAVDKVLITARNTTTWDGSVSSDWFDNANWSDGVPSNHTKVNIPAGLGNSPVINQIGAALLDIKIAFAATLEISGSYRLDVYGDMDVQGSLITNTSTISFVGDCLPTTLNCTGTVSFHSIIVNTTGDVTVESGSWELRDVMTIQAGSFITNDSLTVISDINGTGSIGEIIGVGVSGKITMERYIDVGETNWRYVGSAVSGSTIGDFNDDFTTAGYPGSHFPFFGWVSVYTYDETLAPSLGYIPASSSSQTILTGQGVHVYCGDTITGTQPFVIDFTGNVNQGDVSLNVTYTNTGNPGEDGWNHIANPYPSTIDWDDPDWTKINMANATYIFNPDNGQYATYVAGASTNGGSRYIPSQQAFWVTAFAPGPVLIAKEGVKSNIDQAFLKSSDIISPGLKIRLSGNEEYDEAILRNIKGATDHFDYQYDANKYWGGWGLYGQISLLDIHNKDLTVHSIENLNEQLIIPLRTAVFSDGEYGLDFENIKELGVPCIRLEDTYTGIIYKIEEGTTLLFDMYDTTYTPRFNLILAKHIESKVTDNSCHQSSDGQILIDFDLENLDYTISSSLINTNKTDFANPLVISGLNSGTYTLTIPALINLCGVDTFNFIINQPPPLLVMDSIVNSEKELDGSISVEISGGVGPYTYLWNNGESTALIKNLNAGTYTLTATDVNGCSITLSYEIKSVFGIENSYDSEISFFYNAIDGIITINNFSADGEQEFTIHSVDGKIVDILSVNMSSGNFSYSLKPLSEGMYIINNSNYNFREKFVVNQ